MPPCDRARGPRLLPFTVIAVFLLTTGRWGSYLGLPSASLFVTDLALVATTTWLLLRRTGDIDLSRLRALLPVLVLIGWAIARLAVGGNLSIIAARDFAPYAYMAVAAGACVVTSAYAGTMRVLAAGLLAHLLWVLYALLLPETTGGLPLLGGKVRVLEIRADFDSSVLVVTAALAVWVAVARGRAIWLRAIAGAVAVLSAGMVFELGSRSGVLSLTVVALIVAISQRHLLRWLGWRRASLAAAALVVLGAVLLPHTYVFERLTADPRLGYAGAGSQNARERAWRLVIDDAGSSVERLVLGSGFGRDFLDDSGARYALEGNVDTGVRAPHNFVLNTLGRLGLIGVALLAWVAGALVRGAARTGRAAHRPDQAVFLSFAVVLMAALGTASMVGVILESPFGAVPFWWAAGWLLIGTARQPADPAGQDPAAAADAGSLRS